MSDYTVFPNAPIKAITIFGLKPCSSTLPIRAPSVADIRRNLAPDERRTSVIWAVFRLRHCLFRPREFWVNSLDFLQIMRPVRLAVENDEVRKSFLGDKIREFFIHIIQRLFDI